MSLLAGTTQAASAFPLAVGWQDGVKPQLWLLFGGGDAVFPSPSGAAQDTKRARREATITPLQSLKVRWESTLWKSCIRPIS